MSLVLHGHGSPVGAVQPIGEGCLYVDVDAPALWLSSGPGGTDWVPGGGGGSSPVNVARVVLSNPDVLTLKSSPKQLVATPGLGKMLWPFAALLVCDTTAGAYGFGGSVLGVDYDGTFAAYPLLALLLDSVTEVSNLLNPTGAQPGDPGGKAVAVCGVQDDAVVSALNTPALTLGASLAQDPSGYENLPLVLAADADPTDGNAANALTVTLLYATVTL